MNITNEYQLSKKFGHLGVTRARLRRWRREGKIIPLATEKNINGRPKFYMYDMDMIEQSLSDYFGELSPERPKTR